MTKIVVLGGSFLQSHFIRTTSLLGVEVNVLDGNKHCYCARYELGEFHQLDFTNVERVKSFCLEKEITAIISPANEMGNLIAAEVAEKLGYKYNPLEVVKCSTDKKLVWEKLASSNFCKTKTFASDNLEIIEYPVVVKPTVSTSSKGVIFVESPQEIEDAITYAKKSGKSNDIRIEEFIDGLQYSLETISFNGKHNLLAIVEEHISTAPYFFERTDILDSNLHEVNYNFFYPFINELLSELKVECGPCHIEVRVKGRDIYLIDFAARSGGWRDIMLKYSGVDLNLLILKCYLGQEFDVDDLVKPNHTVGAGIMLFHDDLSKLKKAEESGLICEAFMNGELPRVVPKSLADVYGYYFVKAKNKEDIRGFLPIF